jgi:muramoyltetrapeptide carboxypeptidase
MRGGYGSMRILDQIDYDALARDPKVILGFSDLTALLNAITTRTGLVTFHGPVIGHADLGKTSLDWIEAATMAAKPLGTLRDKYIRTLTSGNTRGIARGGNLSMISSLCGTPYEVSFSNTVLILEDVREPPYRIDRMLTQLRLSGGLHRTAGIVLGNFPLCEPTEDDLPSLTLAETLQNRLSDLGKPVLAQAPIGHIRDQWTVPLGLEAALDSDEGTIVFEEAAVE